MTSNEKPKMVFHTTSISRIKGSLVHTPSLKATYTEGFINPIIKWLTEEDVREVLSEIYEGSTPTTSKGEMVGGKTLGETIFDQPWNKAPCYISKTVESAKDVETYALFPQQNNYHILLSLAIRLGVCGYYGPFSCPKIEFLVFVFNYFTKWIEEETLVKTIEHKILCFAKSKILIRFNIPQVMVTENGTEFTNKIFIELMKE